MRSYDDKTFSKIVPKMSNSSNSSMGVGNTKTPKVQISPAKWWVFTLNNYTKEDIEKIKNLSSSIVPKIRFQSEVGELGTPHLQGFLGFDKKRRPKAKGLFDWNNSFHWEKKKGSVKDALMYCYKSDSKDGKYEYTRGFQDFIKGLIFNCETGRWTFVRPSTKNLMTEPFNGTGNHKGV